MAWLEQAIAWPHCPPQPCFFMLWEAYQGKGRKQDAARVMESLLQREKLPPELHRAVLSKTFSLNNEIRRPETWQELAE